MWGIEAHNKILNLPFSIRSFKVLEPWFLPRLLASQPLWRHLRSMALVSGSQVVAGRVHFVALLFIGFCVYFVFGGWALAKWFLCQEESLSLIPAPWWLRYLQHMAAGVSAKGPKVWVLGEISHCRQEPHVVITYFGTSPCVTYTNQTIVEFSFGGGRQTCKVLMLIFTPNENGVKWKLVY